MLTRHFTWESFSRYFSYFLHTRIWVLFLRGGYFREEDKSAKNAKISTFTLTVSCRSVCDDWCPLPHITLHISTETQWHSIQVYFSWWVSLLAYIILQPFCLPWLICSLAYIILHISFLYIDTCNNILSPFRAVLFAMIDMYSGKYYNTQLFMSIG